jgi:hypothetical protein
MRRYRPGTHHPDDTDRRRILHSTDPSQVSGSISSPGTQESNNLGLKLVCHALLHKCQSSHEVMNQRSINVKSSPKLKCQKVLILYFGIHLTFGF